MSVTPGPAATAARAMSRACRSQRGPSNVRAVRTTVSLTPHTLLLVSHARESHLSTAEHSTCLLYTSDAADDM
eukprot:2586904-Rhodomonas_salina.2